MPPAVRRSRRTYNEQTVPSQREPISRSTDREIANVIKIPHSAGRGRKLERTSSRNLIVRTERGGGTIKEKGGKTRSKSVYQLKKSKKQFLRESATLHLSARTARNFGRAFCRNKAVKSYKGRRTEAELREPFSRPEKREHERGP